MTSPAGDTLDLDITGIAHGGTVVARHEGRVVFVSDAIPGERVRARLAEGSGETRRFWRADAVDVLEASPHRRPHVWPEAEITRAPQDRAGGADLGHIALDHQRVLKRRVLQEALDRFAGGGLEAPAVAGLDDGDGLGWRTRLTLHVAEDGRIGPYAPRSHRVIEVSSHPLARPAVAEAARGLRGLKPGRVDLVEPADGRVRVLARPDRGRHRPAPETIVETVAGRDFRLDAGGFWQVHPAAARTLHDAVVDALAGRVDPDATHFDLYGGVGLLSATLAGLGATDIVTVESDPRATAHARENLADLDVEAVTARVDRFLAGAPEGTRAGTVVLDPPRSGAGRAVVEGVHALSPEAIAYVACDPVALARDLGTFRDLGWRVERLRAFDLFPHTHHFETVALLLPAAS
ncbi:MULTISPECIES: class I SAM-dependent RNA methyltransferase [Microbacterium]|uniref:class I SAM-dependent RNA methyltransferase n=1 Tax=Microbacterium TaxID=33882 RepID=UPI00217E6503|nr:MULTISPECIES: TRAM domain-containing protein [Microbacterium]UWF76899.1 class I SAM-dependent RNA methyltransferase [Microbacterium neungamense]WCM55056.1 class I SAM-dependent RNA methyltransferase [Microbacterium sp. EF45047]